MNLNPIEKKAYNGNIREISDALTRMQAEKDLIKTICETAQEKYGAKPADTRKLGKLYYEQSLEEERAKANELFDLYEDIFGGQG